MTPPLQAPPKAHRPVSLALLACAGVASLMFMLPAPAQQPPKAEPGTASLGGGPATGRLLTKDELRACMARQTGINTRRNELEAQRAASDREKLALQQEADALKAEREKIDRARDAIADVNARTKALNDQVAVFNERAKAVADAKRSGAAADRERAELQREQETLAKAGQAIEADRNAIAKTGVEETVRAFNARVVALDRNSADWNARQQKLTDASQALADERQLWLTECGNRRYREDDEKAIQRGQ